MTFRFLPLVAPALLVGQLFAQSAPADRPAPGTPAPPSQAVEPLPSSTVPEDAVVLSVGSVQMTRKQYEDLLKAMPENVRNQAMGPAKRQVATQIAEIEALAQEARKRKIDDRPEVQQITQLQVNQMLAGFLVQELRDTAKVDAAQVQAYYDAHKSDYQEDRIRHILIRYKGSRVPLRPGAKDLTPEEALAKAQDIKKKLDAGADFAAEAKAESDDTQTGPKGGELGFAAKNQYVPDFANAAFALPVGKISDPVKTPFGYHIIEVEEVKFKPLSEVQSSIESQLKNEEARKETDELREAVATKLNDDFFGKAPSAPSLLSPVK
jgi:parvulin-like peptidyl-prolyl isomerase